LTRNIIRTSLTLIVLLHLPGVVGTPLLAVITGVDTAAVADSAAAVVHVAVNSLVGTIVAVVRVAVVKNIVIGVAAITVAFIAVVACTVAQFIPV